MKKAFIFFLIFFSSFTINQNLLSKNKNTSDFKGCVNDLSKNYFLNYDKIPIKKIEIDTHNYRNWVETIYNVSFHMWYLCYFHSFFC